MTTPARPTDQTTLAANAAREDAFAAAVSRIQEIMLPGAKALCASRTAHSQYWLEHNLDLSASAPFSARTELIWRDHGTTNDRKKSRPFDGDGVTYSCQVIVPSDVSPEILAELARVATIATAELVRRLTATTEAQVSALDAETALLQMVAR